MSNNYNSTISKDLLDKLSPYSKERIRMQNYEILFARDKFVYLSNKVLDDVLETNNIKDKLLLELLYSIILFSSIKDELFNDEYPYDYLFNIKEPFNLNGLSANFSMPELNIDTNIQYNINEIVKEFITKLQNQDYFHNDLFTLDLNNINIYCDDNQVSINDKNLIIQKKGVYLLNITCGDYDFNLKINCGKISEKDISKFYANQMRNIIAHGRFLEIDSYSELNNGEYKTTNWITDEQRKIKLEPINRLNKDYNNDNYIRISYFINKVLQILQYQYQKENNISITSSADVKNLIKVSITKTSNSFFKILGSLYYNIDDLIIDNKDIKAITLLSKFYINFIYNYDTLEKNTFDYSIISTNEQYIYNIRTAIMHGWYKYDNENFVFWTEKNGNIVFRENISFNNLLELTNKKQTIFNLNTQFNINELKTYIKTK